MTPSPQLRAFLSCLLFLPHAPLAAAVELHPLFGDHAVLQCDQPLPVWGSAAPGERVEVAFAGQTRATTADPAGRWRVTLDPLAASDQARELVATGSTTATARDVLVGEVWLASGQSNIRAELRAAHNAAEVLPDARDPALRFFTVRMVPSAEPRDLVAGAWTPTTPDHAKSFSAVGYFFARELRRATGKPVAIIVSGWGGTPIQAWTPLESLRREPPLAKPLAEWDQALARHREVLANPRLAADYRRDLDRWRQEIEPAFLQANRDHQAAKAAGRDPGPKPLPAAPEPANPDPMDTPSPSRRPQTPTVAYNGMIAPLAPFALRGVLWYQGEQDGSRGLAYRDLLPRLIDGWRTLWKAPLPFVIVQLPAFGSDPGPVATRGWPWLREAQAMALKLPRTALAVTLDVGDPADVHPANKHDVGLRAALAARRVAYGETIVASGPVLEAFDFSDGRARLRFGSTGGGLTPGQAPWRARGVDPLPTDRLTGFFIAGPDRRWHPADAVIDGAEILVSSPAVPAPAAVRYGWSASPRCNLYNREGLPAAPFRTDDWPE